MPTIGSRSKRFMLRPGAVLALAVTGLTCLLFPALLKAEPLAMTLEQALERGMAVNAQIMAHESGQAAAREGVRAAVGNFLPTMSFNYGSNRLGNDTNVERDLDYLDQDSTTLSATLSQPIFAGFSGVAGLKLAKAGFKVSGHELKYIQLQVAREIRRDFHAVLHAQERIALWEESIERLLRQQEIVNAWYQQQLATELRLLEVKVELSEARRQLATAQAELNESRARMVRWLALDAPDDFTPVGTLTLQGAETFPPLTDALEISRLTRPDLQVATLRIDQAEQEVRRIAARNLPRVDMEGSWTDFDREYQDARYPDENRQYYNVGVQITFRPFQGGRNIFQWRQQRLQVQRLREELRDLELGVAAEVRAAYSRWQESYSRMQAAADTRAQAEAAWRMARRGLELGAGSLRETLDTELRLTRADLSLLDARLNRRHARADMLFALGEGTPTGGAE